MACGAPAKISIPSIKDDEDDFESLKTSLGEATKFVTFNSLDNSFVIVEGATNSSDIGLYKL